MKKYIPYSLFFLLSVALWACRPINPPEGSTTGGDSTEVDDRTPDQKRDLDFLYANDVISTITLTFTLDDWNQLLRYYDEHPRNGMYVPCQWDFSRKGIVYHRDSVGFRLRGNTSRRRPESWNGEMHRDGGPFHHSHFGVCFTEYETGERFFGCDRMQLKYAHEDPTYVHEIFSFDLMRRFGVWTAPRAGYCRLTIEIEGDSKPVYMGVYVMIENPRKGYLDDRYKDGLFPDKEGNLWKAAWGANFLNADASLMGISDDYGNYDPTYDLKTNKTQLAAAKQELLDFISGLTPKASGSAELKAYLEEHLAVDLFLRTMAVDVVLGQWDGYWGNKNNFYFYFDSNHRLYYIPFDYDNTLGTGLTEFHNPGTQDPLNWGPRDGDRVLCRKVFSIPEYEAQFKVYLKQLVANPEYMQPAAAKQRVSDFQTLIKYFLTNDTGEDEAIIDKPASWGNYHKYRVLSGGVGDGLSTEANFFDTKYDCVMKMGE